MPNLWWIWASWVLNHWIYEAKTQKQDLGCSNTNIRNSVYNTCFFYKLAMVLCQSSYISCGSISGSFVAQLSVDYAGDSVKYNDSNLYEPGTVISIIWRLLISQISIKIYYSNRATLDLKADNQVMACKMTFLN